MTSVSQIPKLVVGYGLVGVTGVAMGESEERVEMMFK